MPEVKLSSLGWKIRHLRVSFIVSATDCKAISPINSPYFAMPLVSLIQPITTFLEEKKSCNLQFDFMPIWEHKQQRVSLLAWKLHKKLHPSAVKRLRLDQPYTPRIQPGYP